MRDDAFTPSVVYEPLTGGRCVGSLLHVAKVYVSEALSRPTVVPTVVELA